jgi:hypothetical protein
MQNIVGVFEDSRQAQSVVDQLVAAGLARTRIHVQSSPDKEFLAHAGPSLPNPGKPGYKRQGVLESIGAFFTTLFESHTDESGIYAKALHEGQTLVGVEAATTYEATKAIDILRNGGAIDLQDHVGQWRADAWGG